MNISEINSTIVTDYYFTNHETKLKLYYTSFELYGKYLVESYLKNNLFVQNTYYKILDKELVTLNSTPQAIELQSLLRKMVDAGVDTGKIIAQVKVPIQPEDDEESLHERIKIVERQLIVETLKELGASS